MKNNLIAVCKTLLFSLGVLLMTASPVFAAKIEGELTGVSGNSVNGWAWNKENTNDVQHVEVHIFKKGESKPLQYLHVEADDYKEELVAKLKDGYHGFRVSVEWDKYQGSDFVVKAYAVKDGNYFKLGKDLSYSPGKTSKSSSTKKAETVTKVEPNPVQPLSSAAPAKAETAVAAAVSTSQKEVSLGTFTTSGYCNCSQCSGGHSLTYSGTVPKANHTISADLTILPLGSKVRIGNVVYTVEDKGSGVKGNWIDIYYDDHAAAWGHGLKQQEVFLIQ